MLPEKAVTREFSGSRGYARWRRWCGRMCTGATLQVDAMQWQWHGTDTDTGTFTLGVKVGSLDERGRRVRARGAVPSRESAGSDETRFYTTQHRPLHTSEADSGCCGRPETGSRVLAGADKAPYPCLYATLKHVIVWALQAQPNFSAASVCYPGLRYRSKELLLLYGLTARGLNTGK